MAQFIEIGALQLVENAGGDRTAGGVARLAVEQRLLTEEVAGEQCAERALLTVLRPQHAHDDARDQVERIAGAALGDDVLAIGRGCTA